MASGHPNGLRTDSGSDIRNGLARTNERTNEEVGSGRGHLSVADARRGEDGFASVGEVIEAGLWPSGERHPRVRVGEREPIPSHVRAAVWFRDGGRCRLCPPGAVLGEWHLDHIKPWSAGGPDTTDNLRMLCAMHNLERSNFVISEERPEIPATWWCSRCYMLDEHPWFYPAGSLPVCPVHPIRHDIDGNHVVNGRCPVQRGYRKTFETTGEWPTWHQRAGLIELHVNAYCAHCGLRGLTEVTL